MMLLINSAESAGFSVEADCDELKAGQACISCSDMGPETKRPGNRHSCSTARWANGCMLAYP